MMTIPQNYNKLRKDLKFDSVSLGYTEVSLFKEEELTNAQVGYGIDSAGNSLISDRGWKENWLVIGYEDSCGDPIIIDLYDTNYPVYTSSHGAGFWELILISETFAKFIQNLEYIKDLSNGRENPIQLEQNPIQEIEKQIVLEKIRSNNPTTDFSFWKMWLD